MRSPVNAMISVKLSLNTHALMLPNEATTVPHFPPLALIAKENKSGKSSGYCCTCHHTIHPNRELFAASARRTRYKKLLF